MMIFDKSKKSFVSVPPCPFAKSPAFAFDKISFLLLSKNFQKLDKL